MPRDNRGGRDPEVVSVDPTVLITRSEDPPGEVIEPTVVITRGYPPARSVQTDQTVVLPSPNPRPRPAPERAPDRTSDATARMRAPERPPNPKPAPPPGRRSGWPAFAWFNRGGSRAQRPPGRTAAGGFSGWSPGARGAVLVVGALVVSAIAVFAFFRAGQWFLPSGQQLTLTRPVGGTLTGAGLECGTRATECTTRRPKGEFIEFTATPDAGYQLSGYTGDCAPMGRMAMSQARTCGATFEPVNLPPPLPSWVLTITPPTGGTIQAAGDIECGALGSRCSSTLPEGVPVKLYARADTGYSFLQFTGDCAPNGETTMSAARTCGASFAQAAVVNASPGPAPQVGGPRRQTSGPLGSSAPSSTLSTPGPGGAGTPATPNPGASGGSPSGAQAAPSSSEASRPSQSSPSSGTPSTQEGPGPVTVAPGAPPPPPPITAEAHAKNEIVGVTKEWCAALQSRQAARVRKIYPLVPESLIRDFKQYKDLKCTVGAAPPEFDLLNASPIGAAQVTFPMKEVVEMQSGGAPKTLDLIVTMKLSRKGQDNPWLIDRVEAVPKPKE
jgi:hypothetical protein